MIATLDTASAGLFLAVANLLGLIAFILVQKGRPRD